MVKIKCNKCGEEFEFIGTPYRKRGNVKIKIKCFKCNNMIEVKLDEGNNEKN